MFSFFPAKSFLINFAIICPYFGGNCFSQILWRYSEKGAFVLYRKSNKAKWMFEYGQNFYILCFIECFLFFAVWMMGYWSPGVFPFPKEGKDQEEDFLKLPQKKISVDVKSKDWKMAKSCWISPKYGAWQLSDFSPVGNPWWWLPIFQTSQEN